MKKIVFIITLFVGVSSFASGSRVGGGGDYYKRNDGDQVSKSKVLDIGSTQVYYVRKQLSEIEFAVTSEDSGEVDIHSMRPEEIQDQSIIEGLKRSRQSKQWERLAIPAGVDQTLNSDKFSSEMKSLKNMNTMKLGF